MEIHVYLTGRLGNQLFQYAMARNLQEQYGGSIVCNTYEFDKHAKKWENTHGIFKYDMAAFNLDKSVKLESKPLPWFADFRNPLIRVIKKICPRLLFNYGMHRGAVLWQREDYIGIPSLEDKDKIILNGWWQDIRYFNNIVNILQTELEPCVKVRECNRYFFDVIDSTNSVCVSIRGGNYLAKGIKEKFFVCDRNYFINAIKKMDSIIDNPRYVIFSDDIEWVKEYINFEQEFPEYRFYYENKGNSVEEKIYLMTKCKHFIISNSTFSWWPQFLSLSTNKVVIAPNNWFTNGDRCGLYQEEWILIEGYKNG